MFVDPTQEGAVSATGSSGWAAPQRPTHWCLAWNARDRLFCHLTRHGKWLAASASHTVPNLHIPRARSGAVGDYAESRRSLCSSSPQPVNQRCRRTRTASHGGGWRTKLLSGRQGTPADCIWSHLLPSA